MLKKCALIAALLLTNLKALRVQPHKSASLITELRQGRPSNCRSRSSTPR